jgi:hypothetical protein
MATFPSLTPSKRRYGFGLFPVSSVDGLGGGPVLFLHGATRYGVQLELGYEHLQQSERDLLLTHYREQDGGHLPFLLPDVIWAGHSNPANIVPAGTAWRYASQPDFDDRHGLLYNVPVQLVQLI